jgi:hypothetical protein
MWHVSMFACEDPDWVAESEESISEAIGYLTLMAGSDFDRFDEWQGEGPGPRKPLQRIK